MGVVTNEIDSVHGPCILAVSQIIKIAEHNRSQHTSAFPIFHSHRLFILTKENLPDM